MGAFKNDSTQPPPGKPAGSCWGTWTFNWPKNYAGVRSLEKLYVILRQNARSNFYLEEERQSAIVASGINLEKL